MRTIKQSLLAIVAFVALATSAQAGSSGWKRERWSEPGQGWTVDYLHEPNSCILSRKHGRGTHLQVLYMPGAGFTLGILNNGWTAIKTDDSYRCA